MNVQNLRVNYHRLISFMERNGYSARYIRKIKTGINSILSEAESKGWHSYREAYLDYEKTPKPYNYLRDKRTIIGIIEQFEVYGRFPDGRRRHQLWDRGAYPQLSPEFKSVIDYCCESELSTGKKETTIYTESHNASTFLFSLQKLGIDKLGDITEEAVMSIFVTPDGKLLRNYSYKKNISAVFKTGLRLYPGECQKILSFIPALKQSRKNIQYLTPQEIQKIRDVLNNDSGSLTLCDRAMGKLALYTGLRGCDIASLTLASIDWDSDVIRINQQKTEVFFKLPLTAVVGNAIYDYLVSERPSVESPVLFLTQNKPYRDLETSSMWNISMRIMRAAGIRQSEGDRKGLHIFRHHFATALLGNDIPQPVISRALGHTSPESTEVYLSADFMHLKECAISIAHIPVSTEVFGDE